MLCIFAFQTPLHQRSFIQMSACLIMDIHIYCSVLYVLTQIRLKMHREHNSGNKNRHNGDRWKPKRLQQSNREALLWCAQLSYFIPIMLLWYWRNTADNYIQTVVNTWGHPKLHTTILNSTSPIPEMLEHFLKHK